MKYGISIAYYGSSSWETRELTRDLMDCGIRPLEIRGCPYPEMTIAEQTRQALLADFDVMVYLDGRVSTTVEAVAEIARVAHREKCVAVAGMRDEMGFAAVPVSALRLMVAEESRRYSNSAVDMTFNNVKSPACPIASPWKRDGKPLISGEYLGAGEAFMTRAEDAGIPVRLAKLAVRSAATPIKTRITNGHAPITGEPGTQFALCVPSYGSLDLDQAGLIHKLAKAGMMIIEVHNCAYIDQARAWLTERALEHGRGVFFLDHDIMFEPNDVMRLCQQALETDSMVAGGYCMRRSGRNIIGSFDVPPGPIGWFGAGSTLPAYYSGLGFAAIPRSIFARMKLQRLECEVLGAIRPWYALDSSTGFYAGEDVSFCNRVHDLKVQQLSDGVDAEWRMSHSGRKCRVFIDTRVRLAHRGTYDYGIEDAGIVVPRMGSLTSLLTESRAEARELLVKGDELPVEMRLAHYDDLDPDLN